MLDRSGQEPELGGRLRSGPQSRTGFEPELGGQLRQKGVYVDEVSCIGCKHCAHVAPNTFHMEENNGRARVINQTGDGEDLVDEAIDTCPADCIHRVDYTELRTLEQARKNQTIKPLGFPQTKPKRSKPKR